MEISLSGILFVVSVTFSFLLLRTSLQWSQQASYRPERFFARVLRYPSGLIFSTRSFLIGISVTLLVSSAFCLNDSQVRIILIALLSVVMIAASSRINQLNKNEKKPFVYTSRATRLFAVASLISLALLGTALENLSFEKAGIAAAFLALLGPFILWITLFLVKPLEDQINRYYLKDAERQRKKFDDLLVLGITGSYGKTTTKHVVQEVVSQKYISLMTPGSVNTDLGLARIIRQELKPLHKIFVAEMGARQIGDIRLCCDVAQPTWGILTCIGTAHLETFGSQQNIVTGKSELVEALPENGKCFLNADDPFTPEIEKKAKCPVITFGVENSHANYSAFEIEVSEHGSSFSIGGKSVSESLRFQTTLLGCHNIRDIVSAIAVGAELGIDWARIRQAVRAMHPVQHRLQLMDKGNGIVVIDDSFNSNPSGFSAALEVLSSFQNKRKFLVTPGMIELGDQEYTLNEEIGKKAAQCCDFVVLVGNEKRVAPLISGLEKGGFSKEALFTVPSLKDAQHQLQKMQRPGDVILFENDLPDIYG
ncbi:MAG: UDP-N-acetylmuramoyl-tripeptide--D-alanyl-D-alanine ligase [Bdellovibrionales bacterium]|nr:UDP-N-acetylmuramoyl-tripeptide--D-alanyl-D-alanine ligase [Bdellovibrionales bacterium]